MKALSIRQPWLFLILAGLKRLENRTWSTPYRGTIALHASATMEDVEAISRRYRVYIPPNLPTGGLLGVADIVDVVTHSDDRFFVGPCAFVLRNVHALPFVRYQGQQRLFDLPDKLKLPRGYRR